MSFTSLFSVAHDLRAVIEVLYFLSGIVLVIVAIKALEQIQVGLSQVKVAIQQIEVSKEIAQTSAKREAYRLAHDQCKAYASSVIPEFTQALAELRGAKIDYFDRPHKFEILNGEFVSHDFSDADVAKAAAVQSSMVGFMNSLEAFAMFFVTGLAAEEIGYRETAIAYCESSAKFMPAFWWFRQHRYGMYKSVVELYELWFARLRTEELQQRKAEIEKTLSTTPSRQIKTIGAGE
jgi:hypothetical protein